MVTAVNTVSAQKDDLNNEVAQLKNEISLGEDKFAKLQSEIKRERGAFELMRNE